MNNTNTNNIRINMRDSLRDSFLDRSSFGMRVQMPHLVFCNCERCSQVDSLRIYNQVMNNYIIDSLFSNVFLEYAQDYLQDEYINALFIQSSSELERNEKVNIDVSSKTYSETEKVFTNCSICSDDYNDDDTVSVLDCTHVFHKNCIEEWGHYNPVCPICKSSIKQKKEDFELDSK
jgi:hypothetical protein